MNDLGLAPGMALKFYTSVAKGLKLKFKMFCGLIPSIVEVYRYFDKYGLHVIQKQVRAKSPDIYRCTMVTQTPRIRCLENR